MPLAVSRVSTYYPREPPDDLRQKLEAAIEAHLTAVEKLIAMLGRAD